MFKHSKKVLITGSLGLIGFATAELFLKKGYSVIGIDNDTRGKLLSIKTNYEIKKNYLIAKYKQNYIHLDIDIRDKDGMNNICKKNNQKIALIVHTAAQTSHDWSAKNPETDFHINSAATFNLLESYRMWCPKSTFCFTSTNKVYGDRVNSLKYNESETHYDLDKGNKYYNGIDENFSIDQSTHSLFGVSKAHADLLVQEYGRYFGLNTGVFRLGVVAGGGQSGAFEQGFLSYLINVIENDRPFQIIGYKGKQVRDIIHAEDVAAAFYAFSKNPKKGEVFNIGGGRKNAYSVLELIKKISILTKKTPKITYQNRPRIGDHQWWISDYRKFKKMYPKWAVKISVEDIISDIHKNNYANER